MTIPPHLHLEGLSGVGERMGLGRMQLELHAVLRHLGKKEIQNFGLVRLIAIYQSLN